jgi:hypothetical protein
LAWFLGFFVGLVAWGFFVGLVPWVLRWPGWLGGLRRRGWLGEFVVAFGEFRWRWGSLGVALTIFRGCGTLKVLRGC